MVVYTCHCLNVKIFAEKPEKEAEPEALETCPLGPACEVVDLVNQGFQFAHKCLVQRLRDGDWTTYVCVPCHMRTHGVNIEDRLVVVNADMNKGEDTIAVMQRSADYSSAFKLVLRPAESLRLEDEAIPRQSYDMLQKQLGDLQKIVSSYCKQEEEAMEARIRKFEEDQRNNLQKLKKQLQLEKTKLVSVLFQKSDCSQTTVPERSTMKRHMTISHSKSSGEYETSPSSTLQQNKPTRRLRDSSPDVFAMDGLDLEEEENGTVLSSASRRSDAALSNAMRGHASPTSVGSGRRRRPGSGLDTCLEAANGDTSRGEEDDDAGDDDYHVFTSSSSTVPMSTSVPISMPLAARSLRSMSHRFDEEDDGSEDSMADIDDIPRQMQALSESIQERDRYIFGDRPRQRVNTGDFTQVKWH